MHIGEKGMIVEYFGLPGSGKTTSMNFFIDNSTDGRKCSTVVLSDCPKSTKLKFLFKPELIKMAMLVFSLWIKKENKQKYDIKAVYYFLSMYIVFMSLRDNSRELFITDHGLIQSLSSIIWNDKKMIEKSDRILRFIAEKFCGSVSYIFVSDNDGEKLYDRIINRKFDIRLKHFDKETVLQVLTSQKDLFEKAYLIFKEKNQVTEITSGESIEINNEKIQEFIGR